MSATPPHPSLPQAEPDQCHFETLRDGHSVVCDTPGSTPSDCGPSTDQAQELGDTSSVDSGYKREDYDHVYECLDSRVFVDLEVLLRSALHVPRDWKALWGPAIEAVKADEKFSTHHRKYGQRCEDFASLGGSFYEPWMKTANSIIDVISARQFDGISGIPPAGDQRKLWTRVTNVSGDIAVPRTDSQPLHWANNIHILEGAICNGKHMPRLIVDGKPVTTSFPGRP
jgi:hypothetical protein